jgi:hypothetical protein
MDGQTDGNTAHVGKIGDARLAAANDSVNNTVQELIWAVCKCEGGRGQRVRTFSANSSGAALSATRAI